MEGTEGGGRHHQCKMGGGGVDWRGGRRICIRNSSLEEDTTKTPVHFFTPELVVHRISARHSSARSSKNLSARPSARVSKKLSARPSGARLSTHESARHLPRSSARRQTTEDGPPGEGVSLTVPDQSEQDGPQKQSSTDSVGESRRIRRGRKSSWVFSRSSRKNSTVGETKTCSWMVQWILNLFVPGEENESSVGSLQAEEDGAPVNNLLSELSVATRASEDSSTVCGS